MTGYSTKRRNIFPQIFARFYLLISGKVRGQTVSSDVNSLPCLNDKGICVAKVVCLYPVKKCWNSIIMQFQRLTK